MRLEISCEIEIRPIESESLQIEITNCLIMKKVELKFKHTRSLKAQLMWFQVFPANDDKSKHF
jgi:hypothetical protein